MFRAQKHTVQIDRLLVAPIYNTHLRHRPRNTRIVHKHVEPAEPRFNLGDDARSPILTDHIMMQKYRISASLPDLRDGMLALIVLHIGDDEASLPLPATARTRARCRSPRP